MIKNFNKKKPINKNGFNYKGFTKIKKCNY